MNDTDARDTERNDLAELVRELPSEWSKMIRNEWSDRTITGRLLFPVWLLYSAFSWIAFFTVWAALLLLAGLVNADKRTSIAYNRLVYGDSNDK